MAIDATVGGASANSYVTDAEATAYFIGRLNAEAWDVALDPEAALLSAARRLDQESYRGTSAEAAQALAWPRSGVTDEDGRTVASDAIPDRVKRAQMELALAMLGDDLLADTGLEGFESVKVGPLDVTPRHRTAGALPANVRRELAPFLAGSTIEFRMERA